MLSKFPADKTTYLGWVDPNSFYPLIDVLVVPSIWAEPFGYVCIEALSFGVPVIVAQIRERCQKSSSTKKADWYSRQAILRRLLLAFAILQAIGAG